MVYNTRMSFVKKLTAHYSAIRVFIAITLLFAGPFLGNLHVSALPMDHSMQSAQSCVSSCVSNQGAGAQQEAIIRQEEKNMPVPPPDEPYFMQFQNLSFQNPLPPRQLTINSSFKPPDFNLLHANFRF